MGPLGAHPVSRRIGDTGMAAHPIGVDGAVFGWTIDAVQTARVLDGFSAAGGNVVSTADHYGGGRSELYIGGWLQNNPRDHFLITTRIGRHPDAPGLSAASIGRAVAASLERLRCDYLDVLVLDGRDDDTPQEEILTACADLIHLGAVHHIGVSGFRGPRLRHLMTVSEALGLPRIGVAVDQYNLMERRDYETGVAPVAEAFDLGVFARLPLASGFLSGVFRTRGDAAPSPVFRPGLGYVGRGGARVLAALDDVAAETDSTPGRVALAWLLSRQQVSTAIVRIEDGDQLVDMIPAAELPLNESQLDRLERVTAYAH
jgi:aryl-alcohol dehydrogenase-like predicted oxidoreductase